MTAVSPLQPHSTSPAELRQRIEAERRGETFLVYRDNEGRQSLVTLADTADHVSIGRNPDNDVALEWDVEVSRLHAELVKVGGEWTIVDDGLSRNGTFLNGQRISGRHRLRDGDVVAIGRTAIAYCEPGGGESRPTVVAGEGSAPPEPTPTQRRVLLALCRPMKESEVAAPATNQQIADELVISVDAVKAHLRALFAMFGVDHLPQNQKRAYLALRALQSGVVSTREL